MILTILIFLVPTFAAAAALSWFRIVQEKVITLLIGAVLGLAAFTTFVLGLTYFFPLNTALLTAALTLTGAIGLFFLHKGAWHSFRTITLDRSRVYVFLITCVLFGIISAKLLIVKPDGFYTGIINAYGDVAWHISNITTFAHDMNLPPENPIFAGTRLTYPFLTNFFSSLLLLSGASLQWSVILPPIVLIPVLLTILYALAQEYTGMKGAAIIVLLLFSLGGATFGFTRFAEDFEESGKSLVEFLTHLPNRDYSGVGTDQEGFHFLNPTTTLLLPQRSFLFGMSIAFALLLLLHPSLPNRNARFITAGLLAGLLPLFHGHTVLALIPPIVGLFLISLDRHWIQFVWPALLVGLPEIFYYMQGEHESQSFFRYAPRWMAGEHDLIMYWFKNTGFLIPLSVIGLFLPAPRTLKALASAGLFLLLISNIFLFAPWAWDNFKLIIFWFILCLPLIGWIAIWITQRRPQPYIQWLVVLLIGLHITSGALDFWKLLLPTAASWIEWGTEEINIAHKIEQVTRPEESILTAPIHNTAVFLAGRPVYLGYSPHVWSHGGNPWVREQATQAFYQGKTESLPETTVDYVLIGPAERSKYTPIVVRDSWKLVAATADYQLYRINSF